MKYSFSTTGALCSVLLTAWYVAAEPEPGATPSFVVRDVAIVNDALGLPHIVRASPDKTPVLAVEPDSETTHER